MFRLTAISLGLLCSLMMLLAACQPIREQIPLAELEEIAIGPQEMGSRLLCKAKPFQRIVVATPKVVCGLGAADETSLRCMRDQFAGIELVSEYEIPFQIFNGIPRDGNPEESGIQYVALFEGPGVTQLDNDERFTGPKPRAIVDPNYFAYSVETLTGFSPGHSPFGISPVSAEVATYTDFIHQWAFTDTLNTVLYDQHDESRGHNVVVGVFDTTPFMTTTLTSLLPMTMTHAVSDSSLSKTTVLTWTNYYTNISGPAVDHGIFVGGLIHQVAPDADIYLYRTLNDSGLADVFQVGQRLQQFYRDQVMNSPSTRRFVANMSFGFDCPKELNLPEEQTGSLMDKFREDVQFLTEVLTRLSDEGVVLVAAAGNTPRPSGSTGNMPLALFPASHDDVISVGASNASKTPACFSHWGEVFASGGDGTGNNCEAEFSNCANRTYCGDALMGYSIESPTGLAYWNGTSFAAPLISGLLALWLSDTTTPTTIPTMNSPSGRLDVVNVEEFKAIFLDVNGDYAEEKEYTINGNTTKIKVLTPR